MTISGFTAYVKQLWKNKPDTSTPLSADRLLHMEDGIKGNSDAIEKIAAAVVSQIVDDPNKIASMAAVYALAQKIGDTTQLPEGVSDVVAAITQQNSNLDNSMRYKGKLPDNNANNADVNGIYELNPSTDMGTSGITANYGVLLCVGHPGGTLGDDNTWRWQRTFYVGSFSGGERTKTNTDSWTEWTAK